MFSFFGKIVFFFLLLLVLGIVPYAAMLPSVGSSFEGRTDAIIVLTGGKGRLERGFALLAEGKGKELLITGVGEGVTLEELLRQKGGKAAEALDPGRVALDPIANSTTSNAAAAKHWMHKRHFTTARLVTADYHMPRALLEFRTRMPEVTFYPEAVSSPQEFRSEQWWDDTQSLKLLFSEYIKYLVTAVRL